MLYYGVQELRQTNPNVPHFAADGRLTLRRMEAGVEEIRYAIFGVLQDDVGPHVGA